MKGYSLENDSLINIIKDYLDNYPNIKLIVLDCLHSLCGKLDVNNTKDMNRISFFKNSILGYKNDLTIILVHHISEKKALDLMSCDSHNLSMGNSVINQQSDEIIILSPDNTTHNRDKKLSKLNIRPISKREVIPINQFTVNFISKKNKLNFTFDKYYKKQESQIFNDIMTLFKDESKKRAKQSFSVTEVYEKLKNLHGIGSIRESLKVLENEGLLKVMIHKPYPFEYILTKKGENGIITKQRFSSDKVFFTNYRKSSLVFVTYASSKIH